MRRIKFILFLTAFMLATKAYAIPNDAEYTECLRNTATDAGITKCQEIEIEAVKNEIENLKKIMPSLDVLTGKQNVLKTLENSVASYIESYCLYYAAAKEGDGYSRAYHLSNCQLTAYLQYYRNLQELNVIATSDIKE